MVTATGIRLRATGCNTASRIGMLALHQPPPRHTAVKKTTSKAMAIALNMDHRALIEAIAQMEAGGLLAKGTAPARAGEIRYDHPTSLELADAMAIIARLQPARALIDAVAELFRTTERLTQKQERSATQQAIMREQLRAILGNRPLLDDAYRTAKPDACVAVGIRIVGDTVWIGTSTEYMANLTRLAGFRRGELYKLLCNIGGAPMGAHRFGGHASRAVAIEASTFVELTKHADEV